jgi:hypothetical protein
MAARLGGGQYSRATCSPIYVHRFACRQQVEMIQNSVKLFCMSRSRATRVGRETAN